MVRNLPANEGDAGSIPGWGTKIPHAVGQLSPCATTTELTHLNEREKTCMPQLERSPSTATKRPPRNEKILHASTKIPWAATQKKIVGLSLKLALGRIKVELRGFSGKHSIGMCMGERWRK